MPRAVDGQLQSAINALQARVSADPEIQAILTANKAQLERTRDRGGASTTFQHRVRDQVTAIAKRKGYLPAGGQYFLNPNDGQLEPHGGWSGLSNKTRFAIIAAAAGGGIGALAAGGALGGLGAAGAAGGGGTTTMVGGVPVVAGLGPGLTAPAAAATAGGIGAGTAAGTAGGIGAGTAAGTAGTVAASGLGASRWLAPALEYGLNYGVPIAAGLIGQRMAASADTEAARIQADYLNRALEVEKEKEQYTRGQRADYLGRLAPYGAAGTAATGRAEALLTRSSYRPDLAGGPAASPAGAGQTVRLRSPDGQEEADVPVWKAQEFLQRGATRI